MAVLRLDRVTTGPAGTGELPTQHAALAAAMKDAFPGLMEVHLAKAGDQRGSGVWRWDSSPVRRRPWPARQPSPKPGRHSLSPKASPPNTPRSSMRARTGPVPGKEAADPCGGRDPRRRTWPAPPLPRLRRGAGRAMAAKRGDEQA
jgi:hypothetical protein